jgi:membrane protease YdiL (CAAX protease family)
LPAWLAWTQVIVLAVLFSASWIWTSIKPLRGLILALLAFCVGAFFISPAIRGSAAYTNWLSQASWGAGLISSPITVHLVPVVLMALTLIGSGLGLRGLFLVRGNLKAPVQPHRLLTTKENVTWNRIGPAFTLIFAAVTLVIMWVSLQPDLSNIAQVWVLLPAILLTAAINAAAEEFQFRSMLLARLESFIKPGQVMWMSALFFASLHYHTGAPSGPFGVLPTLYLGWVAAKSMLETRGFTYAFVLHFIADVVIFACWATTI